MKLKTKKMAIPKFLDFLYPLLLQQEDKDMSTREMKEIQQLYVTLDEQKASRGVFITTSTFTKGAVESAKNATKKIVLIDGEALANYMIKYNVGVSTREIHEIKKGDTDYFEE